MEKIFKKVFTYLSGFIGEDLLVIIGFIILTYVGYIFYKDDIKSGYKPKFGDEMEKRENKLEYLNDWLRMSNHYRAISMIIIGVLSIIFFIIFKILEWLGLKDPT